MVGEEERIPTVHFRVFRALAVMGGGADHIAVGWGGRSSHHHTIALLSSLISYHPFPPSAVHLIPDH